MRGRLHPVPLVLTVVCVLAAVASVALPTGTVVPALALQQSGHWVTNRAAGAALHVHGGTGQVDARVALPAEAARDGLMAVAGGAEGFVVGRDRVWTFDRSTLSVVSVAEAAAPEIPVAIEVVGGPYLVYREAGTVVRLGRPPVVTHAGGPLGPPVRTPDGTVWVHRPDNGLICALRREALELDCGVATRPGAPGGLTVIDGVATFVDTGLDVAQPVRGTTLDPGTPLGTDLPDDALLGDQATGGRLPVVLPGAGVLRLVDVGGAAAVDVPLGPGTFGAPVVGAEAIALIDLAGGRLLTFTPDGVLGGETRLPPGSTQTALSRGEDGRIYVDDPDGGRTHVVQRDGTLVTVDLGAGTGPEVAAAAPTEQQAPLRPPPPGQVFVPEPDRQPTDPGPSAAPESRQPDPVAQPRPDPVVPSPQPPPPVVAVPAAPTDVRAELSGPTEVTIEWDPVDGAGLPVSYTVSRSTGGGTVVSAQGRAVWPDLAPATTYTFVVTASTTAGTSPPSAASNAVTTAVPAPGPPTGLTAQRGPVGRTGTPHIRLDWTAPAAGASPAVEYEVTRSGWVTSGSVNVGGHTTYSDADNYCSPVVTYEVRSVGEGGETSAPATVTVDSEVDCTPDTAVAEAVPEPDGSVTVYATCDLIGVPENWSGPVQLLVDGDVAQSQQCGFRDGRRRGLSDDGYTFVLTGLAPGTTHTVQTRTSSPSGTKYSNTVRVTTVE